MLFPHPRSPCESWSLYKIDHKRDKIGVFVSTVSTKVPFKVRNNSYSFIPMSADKEPSDEKVFSLPVITIRGDVVELSRC